MDNIKFVSAVLFVHGVNRKKGPSEESLFTDVIKFRQDYISEEEATETIYRASSVTETKEFFDVAQSSCYYDIYRFMLCSGC